MRKIIASVDIGSDSIKIIVAEIVKNRPHVLGSISNKALGVSKDIIVDDLKFTESLKESFSKINELIGVDINKVIINVPANDAEFGIGEVVINIEDEDGIIRGSDVSKCISLSVENAIPQNVELISVIPIEFVIDEKTVVKDPKNMKGKTLRCKTVYSTTPKLYVYKVLNCFAKIGIKVSDIVFGTIGDYYAYCNKDTDEVAGVVINIGHETTNVSIFNKGVLINNCILDVGSINIDKDISFIYKLKRDQASYLKENLALACIRNAQGSEAEVVKNNYDEEIEINQYEISEIVSSRIEEILKLTKKQISTLTKKEISYIIITGGLSEIRDFSVAVEDVYGKNATIGVVNTIGIRHNKYSTSLGMIKYYNKKLVLRDKDYSIFNDDELDELSGHSRKVSYSSDSLLGKIFGYFFDN